MGGPFSKAPLANLLAKFGNQIDSKHLNRALLCKQPFKQKLISIVRLKVTEHLRFRCFCYYFPTTKITANLLLAHWFQSELPGAFC